MEHKDLAITFLAIFSSARSTIDGGWNVTLSLDESQAAQVMQLASLKDMVLQVAVVPDEAANYG